MKAYVTGADRGLGLAVVGAFLARGDEVFAGCYGVDPSGLEALAKQHGDRLVILPLDVSSDASVAEAARRIRERTDRIDVLVNNAAILGEKDKTIEDDLSFDDCLRVYNVNALGPLRVSRSMIPLLRKGDRKVIINISSEAGSMTARLFRQQNTRYGYCGSKSALNVQSILLQNHIARDNIHVHLIEPGWLRTWLSGERFAGADHEPDEAAALLLEFLDRDHAPGYLFHDLFRNRRFEW
jgi:NAD(P)-dependent dehydrogenase (short-subunit alcohol dehydrogenase family)